MLMNLKSLIAFVAIVISCTAYSQDFSNKGKDFWVVYSGHIDGTASRMALYITSDQNTSGVVDVNGNSISFNVTANQVTTVQLTNSSNPSNAVAYNSQVEGIGSKKGIHITSLKPVVVYAHILNAARSGSTLVLPTNVLGKQYYVSSYKSINATTAGRKSQFDVIATMDNTTVEIIPTFADGNNTHPAQTPFQITLNKGDVYQYQSNEDLTGTSIRSVGTATASCQPIAVFSGSSFTAMGCTTASSGDNLYQQLFPFASWGKVYYTAPFIKRSHDIFRILVQDPTEPVYVNGVALNTSTLINGRYYEFNTQGNNTPRIITSNKPISVIQYMITMACDGSTVSDPEMVILNAVEQTLSDITVMSARRDLTPPNTNITEHYLNIIYKTNTFSSLKIDGAAPTAVPKVIPGTNYSYIQQDVTASTNTNPAHRIVSDSGFICIAYGYGNVESYGYNAGTNVKDLYQFVTLQNQYATVNFPATCKESPLFFSITLPYLPTSLSWDFSNNPNITPNAIITNNSPSPDSTFVRDGRTLYVFKLPGTFTFSATGTFPIKVTANNPTPDGCSGVQEITYDVEVYDPPVADFNFTHTGCLTDTLHFFDATNGNGRPAIKWKWDFGDGTTDSLKNPLKKYNTADTFNVHLTAITDIGCIADTIKPVVITTVPVAKFVPSSPTCIGTEITFTDSSTIAVGNIVKWIWDFGNGSTLVNATNAAVKQTYTAAGSYTVTLQVESNTGCKSTVFSKVITIHSNPVVDFDLPGVCLPSGLAQFQNLSFVNDNTGNAMTYLWNFGDNKTDTVKNPVHTYSTTGPFSVTLQATSIYGCVKDSMKTFSNIYPAPHAAFTVTAEQCLRDTSVFLDNSNGSGHSVVKWRWSFGDGTTDTTQNPRHAYTTADTFTVKLFIFTDKGCISDTMTKTVIVHPLPSAKFSISSPLCETKQVIITDQSLPNAGTLNYWYWNFGDGSDTTTTNGNAFPKTYTSASQYVIRLAVRSDKGCRSDTTYKTININAQPVPNFILPEVCLSDAFAQFSDSSFIADGTDSSFTYLWNFGDVNANATNPNTSTVKHPKHKYTAIGNYTVSLTITSNKGCTATMAKPFTVNGDIPVADFTIVNAASLCSNTQVQISNAASVNFGTVTKTEIVWDVAGAPSIRFTDNTPSPGKLYAHTYPNFQTPVTKNFQVKFIAYSGASCVDSIIKTITVNASPKVVFSTMPGICAEASPRQITQATQTGPMGSYLYSGTGISASGLFSPSIAGVGSFPIQYLYTSAAGCKDSATMPITVWPSPVAKWAYAAPTCEANAITFSDSSVANFSNLNQWNWDYGDGTTASYSNGNGFAKTYSVDGNYTVSLQVKTDSGCVSVGSSKTIAVHYLPRVNFSLPSVCLPAGKAQFNDLSTIPDNSQSLFTYQWHFGDPNSNSTSTQKNGIHNYSGLGPYTVKLVVTSNNGCIDSISKQLTTIYPQPHAAFAITPAEVCLGGTFAFTDSSTSTSGSITNWQWNFDDGTTSPLQHTSKKYSTAGIYNVSLFVTDQKGCISDTAVREAVVHAYPTVNAGPDLFVLEGGYTILSPTVSGNGLHFRWLPSLYLDNDTLQTPRSTPLADITYKILVTGSGGCSSSDDVFIKVLKAPVIPNAFSPNGDGINDKWVIQYLESYRGATVQIFNRYGQSVFKSDGYPNAWDGTLNGSPLPVGTYYYIIDPKNGRNQISGSVTILR
jgi:gliding motility-associated-like protein